MSMREKNYNFIPLFPKRLKELRKRSYLSQKHLSKKLGVSISAIQNWENKKSAPSLKNVVKIALFFNVSSDYLAGGELEKGGL